ncbi:MAG: transcription-repair coupling factor [Acetatifactor sp.]|nr:transcription-repair coupling factor [Acetatifactor sp.]
MQALLTPLNELEGFNATVDALKHKKTPIQLSGCVDSQKLHMVYGLSLGYKFKVIVTYSDIRAKEIFEEYKFYDRNVTLFPAKDLIFFEADIHGNQLTGERIKTLRRLMENKPTTIITTFAALMSKQILWDREKDVIEIARGDEVDEHTLSAHLVDMGYEKTFQVESPGQFSVRGGIVDIFDLTETNPYRIELWGDEVDSIRSFDVLSQRSIEKLESIQVYPATEFVLGRDQIERGLEKIKAEATVQREKLRGLFKTEEAHRIDKTVNSLSEELLEFKSKVNLESYIDYFYDRTVALPELLREISGQDSEKLIFFMDEPLRIKEEAEAVFLEFSESMKNRVEKGYILPGQMGILYSGEAVAASVSKSPVVTLSTMDSLKNGFFKPEVKDSISARNIAPYNNSFESLCRDLKNYKKNNYRVVLLSGSRTRAARLAGDLRDEGITAVFSDDPMRKVSEGEVLVAYGFVGRGFEYPMIKFVVMTETDIFGARKKKKKKKFNQGTKISSFDELKVGDYVVHESHGLGIYRGIEKVEVEKVVKDYIKIEYKDGGNLYISATGLDVIQKYASADAEKVPKLNKLGSKEWEKTKSRVKSAVNEVAKDLVELYAKRQQAKGYHFGADTVWQREFEEMFPFEETEDQLTAIADTKSDMESDKVMDRLVCGDVGYGKTEIAIRAAFKAVQEGKQVVYLVPTTILAGQHYNTFAQRMKDFPVRVEQLSRFRTASEQKKVISDLEKGFVDIVIGTHRVLSNDVKFKDLGLLIIDEEQRFGVTHKEKIKKLKENVDVLTLTATPIPRTLHMSLIGIRDMSILEEAPEDRMPIQTFVMEYNEEMVREAIVRELARGGQVYYVYNRVSNIADVAAMIQNLVPEANVAYAHGQMNERDLEQIMYDFVNGEVDVLVSTTIIETGLDISNVNTIIIHDSDRLGLSQLYQLRGRVGRSNRTAYAFLMYKKDTILKEVAEKRLDAIREFTDLGSGFKIAMRDLEIRGAGNLLGMRQHGHMEAVGYDLYCKMLNEAVKNLKGEKTIEDFATVIDLDVDAFIPPEYILNEVQKLDIYKRIAGVWNVREKEDIKDELIDRFGNIPKSVENLLRIALIRVSAHRLYMTEVKGKNERIIFTFKPDAAIDPMGIPKLIAKYGKDMSFTAYGNPFITYKYKKTGMVEKDEELLLDKTEELLFEMEQVLIPKA